MRILILDGQLIWEDKLDFCFRRGHCIKRRVLNLFYGLSLAIAKYLMMQLLKLIKRMEHFFNGKISFIQTFLYYPLRCMKAVPTYEGSLKTIRAQHVLIRQHSVQFLKGAPPSRISAIFDAHLLVDNRLSELM